MTSKIPSTEIYGSPIEHTLEVLEGKLSFAEKETRKLTDQLAQYGFQRFVSN